MSLPVTYNFKGFGTDKYNKFSELTNKESNNQGIGNKDQAIEQQVIQDWVDWWLKTLTWDWTHGSYCKVYEGNGKWR